MNRRRWVVIAALMLVAAPVFSSHVIAGDDSVVRVKGSRYLYYTIFEMARSYMGLRPEVRVEVEATDVGGALWDLMDKKADALMVFGKLDSFEKGDATHSGLKLVEQLVGRGGVAIITNNSNPVESLTVDQVRKLFTGEYTNWKEVGGPDLPVVVMTRPEELSGTRRYLKRFVLQMSFRQDALRLLERDIVKAVWKQEKGAIADARYNETDGRRARAMVKTLAIKRDADSRPIKPSDTTVKDLTYPISGPLMLYYDAKSGNAETEAFVNYCQVQGLGSRLSKAR